MNHAWLGRERGSVSTFQVSSAAGNGAARPQPETRSSMSRRRSRRPAHRVAHKGEVRPGVRCEADQIEQVMSCPQHIGDLTLPCPPGHSEMCTDVPSDLVKVECTSSFPHCPQVIDPMLIPHFSHL